MPQKKPFVAFKNVTLLPAGPFLNWKIKESEQWLITGDSDLAKKEILAILAGRKKVLSGNVDFSFPIDNFDYQSGFSKKFFLVNFLHPSVLLPDAFYQQRYHASESESGPTLREYIGPQFEQGNALFQQLKLDNRLDEPIIHLSTGEFRKLSILLGLLKKPEFLVLNEPYAGLDPESIEVLDSLLQMIIKEGIKIILLSQIDHIPLFITHSLVLDHSGYYQAKGTRKFSRTILKTEKLTPAPVFNLPQPVLNFKIALSLRDLTIHDGHKKILDCVNWTVRKGEKWALIGHNGAGKSMLLSVIFADHPQAYANEITLFDKLRGSGESIWEIRENIGYFSSELFLYSDRTKTCRELAYLQFNSNPYKFDPITHLQQNSFYELMEYFSLKQFIDSPLQSLPQNLQRLAFLVTIFMKNSSLLILDEPFHGFDQALIFKLKRFLDQYCENRTLIFVSHRKSEIPSVVTSFIAIHRGEV